MKPFFEKLKNDKAFRIVTIISITAIILAIIAVVCLKNTKQDENTIAYKDITETVKNKEDMLIYYYNSGSTNENHKEIKEILDQLGIRYYQYDDKKVTKEEYNNFLDLMKIDKDLFGMPALIYIKDGEMYANLININNKQLVEDFINEYDLHTVK